MKKFGMLFSTIAVVLITLSTYIYQNTGIAQVNYNYPNIHIESSKYGNILNMQLIDIYKECVLFLAEENPLTNKSMLYLVNLDNGEVQQLADFEKHKNLKDILSIAQDYDDFFTASPLGINKLELVYDSQRSMYNANFAYSYASIPDFKDAINFDCHRWLYYTKANDRFLYEYKAPQQGMFFFNTPNTNNMTQKYNLSPQSVFSTTYSPSIYYTKLDRNGLNLYGFTPPQNELGINNKLIIKDVIYPRISPSSKEIVALIKAGDGYGIYIDGKIIDYIPSRTSLLNQLPDVQFCDYNNKDIIAYMKFNPDHNGSIILSDQSKKTEIVKNAPIIGQLRFSRSGKSLMYFTFENNKVMVKLYNIEDKTTRDITDMFY